MSRREEEAAAVCPAEVEVGAFLAEEEAAAVCPAAAAARAVCRAEPARAGYLKVERQEAYR